MMTSAAVDFLEYLRANESTADKMGQNPPMFYHSFALTYSRKSTAADVIMKFYGALHRSSSYPKLR